MNRADSACPVGFNAGAPRDVSRGEAMPGLPKVPAAERIDVDENGRISGLF